MKTFLVKVTETASHTYVVQTESQEEAERYVFKINEEDCNLVDSYDDYDDTEIAAREVTDEEVSWYDKL